MKAIFLGRAGCAHSERAKSFLRARFAELRVIDANGTGAELDPGLIGENYDALFAFRSHIIVRRPMLDAIPLCINFHPGPPERRGAGCVNFALIGGDDSYGSTCHHMAEEIDAGEIIDVRRFPIYEADTVASVLGRTYDYMLCQLYDIAGAVAEGAPLSPCGERWTGPLTRSHEMNALREIDLATEARAHLERQIRATSFGSYRPYVVLHGRRFTLDDHATRLQVA